MDYYAILKGVQIGPIDADNLVSMPGFSGQTMVWHEGLDDWTQAANVAELTSLIGRRVAGPVPPPIDADPSGGSGPRINYYAAPGYPSSSPVAMTPDPLQRPYNWIGWSVFNILAGLLFGFFASILGVVGLIYAIKANDSYAKCDYAGARSAARTAKTLNLIALVVFGCCILLCLLVLGLILVPFVN